jgi:hypothetical protein
MANWRDSIPSKWLKASDLDGKPRLVTIKRFSVERLQDGSTKPAVWFREEAKALILNVTNGKSVEKIMGSADPANWIDKRIVIFPTETEMGGEQVDCIRVRATKPGAKLPPPPPVESEAEEAHAEDDFHATEEDVPF